MNVHYFNHALYPGILANKIQRIQMANAFAQNRQVERVFFYCILNSKKDLAEVKKNLHGKVSIKPVVVPGYCDTDETKHKKTMRKWLIMPAAIVYLKFLFLIMLKKFSPQDLCYIRGDAPVVAATIKKTLKPRFRFMFEIHNEEFKAPYSLKDRFYCKAFEQADKIVTVAEGTKSLWVENGFEKSKIEVLPSGVDVAAFDKITQAKGPNRKKLGLPFDKKIVLYSGQLHNWKGVDTLINSFSYNTQNEVQLYILGGAKEDITAFQKHIQKKNINNVNFLGNKPHALVPYYLKSADLLVLPNTAKSRISLIHTSPIKLLEYMASRTPIIASNLPSIREIASDKEVIFFRPDSPKSLHDKIMLALKDYPGSQNRAKKAYDKVKAYTWEERVKKIIRWFMQNEQKI